MVRPVRHLESNCGVVHWTNDRANRIVGLAVQQNPLPAVMRNPSTVELYYKSMRFAVAAGLVRVDTDRLARYELVCRDVHLFRHSTLERLAVTPSDSAKKIGIVKRPTLRWRRSGCKVEFVLLEEMRRMQMPFGALVQPMEHRRGDRVRQHAGSYEVRKGFTRDPLALWNNSRGEGVWSHGSLRVRRSICS